MTLSRSCDPKTVRWHAARTCTDRMSLPRMRPRHRDKWYRAREERLSSTMQKSQGRSHWWPLCAPKADVQPVQPQSQYLPFVGRSSMRLKYRHHAVGPANSLDSSPDLPAIACHVDLPRRTWCRSFSRYRRSWRNPRCRRRFWRGQSSSDRAPQASGPCASHRRRADAARDFRGTSRRSLSPPHRRLR